MGPIIQQGVLKVPTAGCMGSAGEKVDCWIQDNTFHVGQEKWDLKECTVFVEKKINHFSVSKILHRKEIHRVTLVAESWQRAQDWIRNMLLSQEVERIQQVLRVEKEAELLKLKEENSRLKLQTSQDEAKIKDLKERNQKLENSLSEAEANCGRIQTQIEEEEERMEDIVHALTQSLSILQRPKADLDMQSSSLRLSTQPKSPPHKSPAPPESVSPTAAKSRKAENRQTPPHTPTRNSPKPATLGLAGLHEMLGLKGSPAPSQVGPQASELRKASTPHGQAQGRPNSHPSPSSPPPSKDVPVKGTPPSGNPGVKRSGSSENHAGVGIKLRDNPPHRVEGILEGGPAHRSGRINTGDLLLSIDGVDVHGESMTKIRSLVSGPYGSAVDLEFSRFSAQGSKEEVYRVTLERGGVLNVQDRPMSLQIPSISNPDSKPRLSVEVMGDSNGHASAT